MYMTLNERVEKIVRQTFNLSNKEIDEKWTSDDIAEWDSMGHLQLIMAIEKEFNASIEIEEMFERLSPFYGEKREGGFEINENGEIYSCEPFSLMLGTIGKIMKKEQDSKSDEIKNELQKIQRYLKYAIPELENLIECPHCKEYNPPDGLYCIRCTKKIIIEESNEKKDK